MPSLPKQDYLWIAVGDIHDDAACFARIPELAQADGIIVTGDLTITGGAKQAELVMDVLWRHCPVVWAQIGNMDRPEVDAWLSEKGCNLHTRVQELTPDIALFGVGGSTFTPFGTPSEFPEASFAEWLNACWQRARVYPHTILVSHNPPKDTACDVIPGDVHVGSTAVREFLEEAQPAGISMRRGPSTAWAVRWWSIPARWPRAAMWWCAAMTGSSPPSSAASIRRKARAC